MNEYLIIELALRYQELANETKKLRKNFPTDGEYRYFLENKLKEHDPHISDLIMEINTLHERLGLKNL